MQDREEKLGTTDKEHTSAAVKVEGRQALGVMVGAASERNARMSEYWSCHCCS
jgi:hypothetical protein